MGQKNVEETELRMGAEDFGYYTQVVPGCFFRLGVRNESKGIIHQVHTPKFDIDEFGNILKAANKDVKTIISDSKIYYDRAGLNSKSKNPNALTDIKNYKLMLSIALISSKTGVSINTNDINKTLRQDLKNEIITTLEGSYKPQTILSKLKPIIEKVNQFKVRPPALLEELKSGRTNLGKGKGFLKSKGRGGRRGSGGSGGSGRGGRRPSV